jgi:hypothetical protein
VRAWAPLSLAIAGGALASGLSDAAPASERGILAWPGPAPQLRARDKSAAEIADWNAGCVSCHATEAAAWSGSRHRHAFDNEPFQNALAREPESTRSFCVGCHAPEAQHAGGEATELGVACITCHTPLGPVLASRASGKAPHGTFASTSFRSTDSCKRCHEFEFPRHGPAGGLMQRTISEHDSANSEATCVSCHMPSGAQSHAFPGGYDSELLKKALAMRAERRACNAVLTLTPNGVTHAVPTGDLFRRLAVSVTAQGEQKETRYLARHFMLQGGRRIEISDDRPHLAPREVRFSLGGACDVPFSYAVSYQRVGFIAGDDEANATIESEVLIADGRVAAP